MRDFEHSTLWPISSFERMRVTGVGFDRGDEPTLLPTTLLADLDHLSNDPDNNDVIEVLAACLRHREPALLYLQLGAFVWPLTVFPAHWLAHSSHDIGALAQAGELAQLKVLSVERPGVRPPGHWMVERIAATEKYRPLRPILWTLAMEGPRHSPLNEIGGRAAYRITSTGASERPATHGAMTSAMQRLRHGDAAPLREIAAWPGMSIDRASRLLNALYLTGGLMVTRSHPAAREQPQRLGPRH